MAKEFKHLYEFGCFRLDPAEHLLLRDGEVVALTPKAFDLLLVLVNHQGHLLGKDELMRELWPDSFVEEGNLADNISRLRKALGESAGGQRFIETVPKRGYRFVAPVREVREEGGGGTIVLAESSFSAAESDEEEKGRDEAVKAEEERRQAVEPERVTTPGQESLVPPRLQPRRIKRRWLWSAVAFIGMLIAGLALWLGVLRRAPVTPTSLLKVVNFTSFPGREITPMFSPDGNSLAFAWNGEHQNNFDIYVKLLNVETPLRLTTDPADETSPAFSPDGRYIAFLRRSVGGSRVYIIPSIGGPERKLTESFEDASNTWRINLAWFLGRALDWSPDGKFIAMRDKRSPQAPYGISLISVETGEKRAITSPLATLHGDYHPAFSPDGSLLAFLRGDSLAAIDIYVIPAAGGEARRITSDNQRMIGMAWTAEGGELVFFSERGGEVGLWRVSASGGTPERVMAVGGNAIHPHVAPVGDRLAYVQNHLDTNIWRIEASSQAGKADTPTRLIASTQADSNPQYSPDGRKITFNSNRSGSDEIWVCDADGSRPMRLTHFNGHGVGSPRWSPDGQRIAFDSRQEGHADIYVVRADGGRPRRITTEPSSEVRPSWSRDGRFIYFGSDRTGNWQVWKAPAEGGAAVQVTKGGGREACRSQNRKPGSRPHQPRKIVGDDLVEDRLFHRRDDQIRRFDPTHVPQHHLGRQNQRTRIDVVLAGILRRRAVRRFEHRHGVADIFAPGAMPMPPTCAARASEI